MRRFSRGLIIWFNIKYLNIMKNLNMLPLIGIILTFCSCSQEQERDMPALNKQTIGGYVQKGPFLNGTSISVSEFSEEWVPTGRNFSTQITDNKGTFELLNLTLISPYVELEADGFYYNEVTDENATAQLTLYALSDLSDTNSLNVNVLTHLERNRVKHLIANGLSFSEAKSQSQSEILSLFEIDKEDVSTSELLDITKQGDDNAILLAVSVILQGNLSVSELSELLANMSTDLREDGLLDNPTLGSMLIDNARFLKLEEIRQHLEDRYEVLDMDVSIADFEKYVKAFTENTDFVFTRYIEYPAAGQHGLNILDREKTRYEAGDYSMKAVLPEGTSLKVKICGDNWAYPALQNNTGWERSDWNATEKSRLFTSVRTGEIDFKIRFRYQANNDASPSDTTNTSSNDTNLNKINVFVYENDTQEPTWTKEITIRP